MPARLSQSAYGTDGYTVCKDDNRAALGYAKTVDLGLVPTNIAVDINGKTRYLYNLKGKIAITNDTFGVPGVYEMNTSNPVYCQAVQSDTAAKNAAMFTASTLALERHVAGASVLTATQINDQASLITASLPGIAYSDATVKQAFALIDAYDTKIGPLFVNKQTREGLKNSFGATDGFELARSVMTVQQAMFDQLFSNPAVYAKYKTILKGKSFATHAYFPGAVKVKADPLLTYKATIKATFPRYNGGSPSARLADYVGGRAPRYSDYPQRRPTGYYLAAGDTSTVVVPQALVGKGYQILVGAHQHDKTHIDDIKRFFKVSQTFDINNTSTEIYNPFGGGIYIVVPLNANDGVVTVDIANVVPAPFFSATSHAAKTTNAEWQKIQRNNAAPWADFESDTFMLNVPTAFVSKYVDPVGLMADWDKRLSTFSYIFGQQPKSFPTMYQQVEVAWEYVGFLAAGYPSTSNLYSPNSWMDPKKSDYGNANVWYLKPGAASMDDYIGNLDFHEFGHAQHASFFDGESEVFVNFNFVAVTNRTYGTDFDVAFGQSRDYGGPTTRAQAAFDWMKTPQFRSGQGMVLPDMGMYQSRGHAKYVDIAALFGWEPYNKFYVAENLAYEKKLAGDGFTARNSRIFRFSLATGVDLRPLFHFWGIQPDGNQLTDALMAKNNLVSSRLVYDRLVAYKSAVPADNKQFNVAARVYLHRQPDYVLQPDGKENMIGEKEYYQLQNLWDASYAKKTTDAIDTILQKYFPAGRPAAN